MLASGRPSHTTSACGSALGGWSKVKTEKGWTAEPPVRQQRPRMKSISASIVIFAGAGLILGGGFVPHGDSGLFVQAVGCILGGVALFVWLVNLKGD